MRNGEKSVLRTYRRTSPSRREADTPEAFKALIARRTNILNKLNLHPRLFLGAELIDMGCGTGEHSAVYARYGARVSGVEFNPESVARMRGFFARHGLALREIFETAISEWRPATAAYNIGVSDGVIHHLSDPREGLAKLASSIKPGGLMVVSTSGFPGAEQREIMRAVIRRNCNDLRTAVEMSLRLFPTYMERAVRLGERTAEQVVNDNFLVEINETLSLETVARWFSEEGFSYYRVYPPVEPHTAASPTDDPVDWFKHPEGMMAAAAQWAICRDGELVDATLAPQNIAAGMAEIAEAGRLAGANDLAGLEGYLPGCRFFGRGYCGVGAYFVVGQKNAQIQYSSSA